MISCNDITYLEYAKIITRQYSSVPLLLDVPADELEAVRSSIAAEFQDLIGDLSYKNYNNMVDQFKKLDLKRLTCLGILTMLEIYSIQDESVQSMLGLLRITITEESSKDLVTTQVLATLKKCELRMKSLELELTSINNSAGKKEVVEADLIKAIASISVGLMFSVSIHDNATVIAGYINILNKQQEKQNGKVK